MKNVFIDTNVLLDFVTQREGFENACDIFQLCEDKKVKLFTSYLSMANTAYVARKGRTKEELYFVIKGLSEIIEVLAMDKKQLNDVLAIKASDMEDAMQYVCAKEFNCDAIITRNTKDFSFSEIPILTPKQFLGKY